MKIHIIVILLMFLAPYEAFARYLTVKHIRSLWKERMIHNTGECMSQSHVNPRVVEEFFEYGYMPHSPAWKCYLECCGRELGILSRLGDVNVQKWVDIFSYVDLPLAQECVKIEEQDVCEKAYMLLECALGELTKLYPS
ncbi:hypothetical protein ILUMI_17140 [Ignelater luminosus]|uniref:Uncharacterized protein n=1 Tax=Ignelater luminosus TaxID=2038154 RepID=A0A8K0G876_IGNLU|nr:hypothetical protein ILUMI_17140 [Ignelater luminosus]